MSISSIPNYIRVAYWVYLQPGGVSCIDIMVNFNISEKQLSFYISTMLERKGVLNCSVHRDEKGRFSCGDWVEVSYISKGFIELMQCEVSEVKLSRGRKRKNQINRGEVESYLWHLVLKTTPPPSSL